MANPSALSDSEGEYYEILNNSSKAINLEGLILTRNETDSHTIGDSIVLQPGDYYVLAKTETATQAGNEYIYGSSITLPNSGAGLYIYNADDGSGRGELIFMVDYSLSGFPVGTGASIVLNPSNYNTQDAVEGSSWCVSTSEYSTGDKGTPGILNDTCN
jgi:hypothetical protein